MSRHAPGCKAFRHPEMFACSCGATTPQQPPGSDPSLPEGYVVRLTSAEIELCVDGLTQREMWGSGDALATRLDDLLLQPPSEPSIPVSVLKEIVARWEAEIQDRAGAGCGCYGKSTMQRKCKNEVEALLQEKA